jgi:DNA-binding MarR family transcriptional regulator
MRKPEDLDHLFHALLTRFFTIRTRQPASGAVTFAQMRLLWTLERSGETPLTTLAGMLGVGNSTATELADRLVRGRYATRRTSVDDRRRILLALTSRGRGLLQAFARTRRERFRRLMNGLTPGDVDRLARALATAGRLLEKARA